MLHIYESTTRNVQYYVLDSNTAIVWHLHLHVQNNSDVMAREVLFILLVGNLISPCYSLTMTTSFKTYLSTDMMKTSISVFEKLIVFVVSLIKCPLYLLETSISSHIFI